MGLESTHPQYDIMVEDWDTMRHLSAGERAVKAKRDLYLPPTPSMILDGFGKGTNKLGEQTYNGYLKRAQFPDYVSEGVEILVGMLNHKPPTVELPKIMEPMIESCTLSGESINDLIRQMHVEQLTTGRLGIMADLPVVAAPATNTSTPATDGAPAVILPYIALYVAEAISNWDEAGSADGLSALNLVVLNETTFKRSTDFTWKEFKKYRVLQLGDILTNEAQGEGNYLQGVFDQDSGLTYAADRMEAPVYKGKKLKEIPFVFVNTRDLVGTPDKCPLMGLARLVLAIYRGEADYRQSLFLTGQDTLVVVGGVKLPDAVQGEVADAIRVGAGSRIDVDINGDAKFIGVNSQGLSEQRQCLENDHKRAASKSGQLLPTGKANSQESGEALKTRLSAQTASLTQIAMTAAKGLEVLLKTVAEWVGANPDEVKVQPNMEFGELELSADEITKLMTARMTGAPLSKKSIHALLVEKRLTNMTYEEEIEQIKEEDAEMPRVAAGAGTLTAEEQIAQQEEQNRLTEEKNRKAAAGGSKAPPGKK